jgi:hypothetical protein
VIAVLDQGNVSSCTGNATVGALGTSPAYAALSELIADGLVLDEDLALKIYSEAETIDGDGPYPPNDNGSSGLSVAKAAKNNGLISGYTHITNIAQAQTAIQSHPFIVGSDWMTDMDNPDENGVVQIGGSVRGGHEYECVGYDSATDLWEFVNSWGTSFGKAGHFFYNTANFHSLLSNGGDATVLLPLTAPAPVPQPVPPVPTPVPPGPAPTPPAPVAGTQFVITDPALVAHISAAMKSSHYANPSAWLTHHLQTYFGV